MGKVCLFLATITLTFTAAATADAQTRTRYVFDNFDTASGVKIYTPAPQPKPAQAKTSEKKTNKQAPKAKPIVMTRESVAASLKMGGGRSLGTYSTGDAKIDNYIVNSSQRYNIDPLLIYAQMHQESSFKLKAISYKGARGLMQLMPATAARFGVTNIFDPEQNIDAGVKYMRWLLNTFGGDVRLALAGYNAGEGAVMKYGYQIPPYRETQDYVARITARYSQLRDPKFIRSVPRTAQNEQVAKQQPKTIVVPSAIYTPTASAVRLPNGKIQLVTQ